METVFSSSRTGPLSTVTSTVGAATGAVSLLSTVTSLLSTVPSATGEGACTVSERMLARPAGRSGRFQVTTPLDSVPPAEAETKITPGGSVSRTTTPVAVSVPVLP